MLAIITEQATTTTKARRSDRLRISQMLICEQSTKSHNYINSTLTSIFTAINNIDNRIPLCHKHVLTSSDMPQWLEAEQKELDGLWEVGAWIWAKCPDNVKPIMSKWTYNLKTNAEGVIQRYKAICARGDQTKERIDYEETFSPVVK